MMRYLITLNSNIEILFTRQLRKKVGSAEKHEDFSNDVLDYDTPQGTLYDDDSGVGSTPTPHRDDLEEDHYDNFLNSKILLPLGCCT